MFSICGSIPSFCVFILVSWHCLYNWFSNSTQCAFQKRYKINLEFSIYPLRQWSAILGVQPSANQPHHNRLMYIWGGGSINVIRMSDRKWVGTNKTSKGILLSCTQVCVDRKFERGFYLSMAWLGGCVGLCLIFQCVLLMAFIFMSF